VQRLLNQKLWTPGKAVEYDAMDFTEVNTAFAQRVIELGPQSSARVLDAGTQSSDSVLLKQYVSMAGVRIDLAKNMHKLVTAR